MIYKEYWSKGGNLSRRIKESLAMLESRRLKEVFFWIQTRIIVSFAKCQRGTIGTNIQILNTRYSLLIELSKTISKVPNVSADVFGYDLLAKGSTILIILEGFWLCCPSWKININRSKSNVLVPIF